MTNPVYTTRHIELELRFNWLLALAFSSYRVDQADRPIRPHQWDRGIPILIQRLSMLSAHSTALAHPARELGPGSYHLSLVIYLSIPN
jgi:hypothetical protein